MTTIHDEECRAALFKAHTLFQQGQERQAQEIWAWVLRSRPNEPEALDGLGQSLFRSQAFAQAKPLFSRLTELRPEAPVHWVQLSLCCQHLGQEDEQARALTSALKADPHDLLALLLRGELLSRQGRRHEAARAYGAALQVAPQMESLHPQLHAAWKEAVSYRDLYQAELATFMDDRVAQARREVASGEDLGRFDLSVDIMLGRKRRYESQPQRYFMPLLRPVEFFDRQRFPWLEEVESRWQDIRAEFLVVMESAADWKPYIQYKDDQPLAQWKELNRSLQWSAYHLWKDGRPVEDHLQRCPVTRQTLAGTPQPDQPGRTPVAMFSLLKPRTRIPPHVGASNARLVCHLPLVVPAGCGFRVGNETRQWTEGRAWVFDDTIEHEAWNDGDDWRVVLIWDTWHPDLSGAERRMITAMNGALQDFLGFDDSYEG